MTLPLRDPATVFWEIGRFSLVKQDTSDAAADDFLKVLRACDRKVARYDVINGSERDCLHILRDHFQHKLWVELSSNPLLNFT